MPSLISRFGAANRKFLPKSAFADARIETEKLKKSDSMQAMGNPKDVHLNVIPRSFRNHAYSCQALY